MRNIEKMEEVLKPIFASCPVPFRLNAWTRIKNGEFHSNSGELVIGETPDEYGKLLEKWLFEDYIPSNQKDLRIIKIQSYSDGNCEFLCQKCGKHFYTSPTMMHYIRKCECGTLIVDSI